MGFGEKNEYPFSLNPRVKNIPFFIPLYVCLYNMKVSVRRDAVLSVVIHVCEHTPRLEILPPRKRLFRI